MRAGALGLRTLLLQQLGDIVLGDEVETGIDDLGNLLALLDLDRFLAIDPDAIPLPEQPRSVAGTPLDFRNPFTIGARIRDDDAQLRNGRGYDHKARSNPRTIQPYAPG